MILVHALTEATGDAATTALDLLTAVEGPLVRVTADAASDTVAGYELTTARGATVIIPPAKTATVSGHGPRSPARDRTITVVKQLGENTCFRDTSIIGDGLRARSPARQGSAVVLGCEILNRMTALGRPASSRLVSHRTKARATAVRVQAARWARGQASAAQAGPPMASPEGITSLEARRL